MSTPHGHDQRRCRFFARNPDVDASALPPGKDRSRAALFLCYAKGKPLPTTMVKCRYCRENNIWYQPREDSPDYVPMAGRREEHA